MSAAKKQVIMCMPTAPEDNNNTDQEQRNSKQYLIMEFNEQEFETKMSKMKNGETTSNDGTESLMTEFSMYKAQRPSSKAKGNKKKSIYIPCAEEEVLRIFGTNSCDEIMEFYYKNCCPK